ncbi:MAG: class I SAM-dependent methyltransferase [Planctomycetales bacterium]|nr:class I SAM-dependent methyltransferase [Planctomycetales bacterium]
MSQIDQIQNFSRLASLCGASEVLLAARRTGLMTALDGPPKALNELAELCDMPAERLSLLLDVLVSTGAVERYGDDFALSTAMRLVNHHPNALHGPHWSTLRSFLCDGDSTPPQEHAEEAHHAYRGDTLSLQWTLTAAAMELAEQLQIGQQRRGLRILDLGAGSAMWSGAMAYRDPESHVTAVDLPGALEAAERTGKEIDISARLDLIPGDYRTLELPEAAFDVVLAVDLLQLQPLEQSEDWLRRVHLTLCAGGELILVGRFAGQPRGDLHRVLGALELALRVPGAQLHSAEEVGRCLEGIGFEVGELMLLDAPPYSLGALVARR